MTQVMNSGFASMGSGATAAARGFAHYRIVSRNVHRRYRESPVQSVLRAVSGNTLRLALGERLPSG
jgi:hypothetical protein